MRLLSALLLLPCVLLSGCDGFFFKTSTTTAGTGSGDYAFVGNAGSNTVTGFSISTAGALAAMTGSPISLSYAPTAIAVGRTDKYVWVGTSAGIFGYSISSTGALAVLNSGSSLASVSVVDLQTSPDGKWLLVLDGTGASIDLYAINADGTLTVGTSAGFVATGTVVAHQLRMAPTGGYMVAALGTAGSMVFAFNTANGAITLLSQTPPPALTSDNGVAIDSTGTYLYTARSGSAAGLVVFTVGSNGALTPTTSTVYGAGSQPYAVTLDSTGKYVYVANRGDGTITGYGIGTSAVLTSLTGSPYSAGVGVTALGADSTGKWLLAANYSGSPDLALFGFDSSNLGRLYTVSSVSTGTDPGSLALSY